MAIIIIISQYGIGEIIDAFLFSGGFNPDGYLLLGFWPNFGAKVMERMPVDINSHVKPNSLMLTIIPKSTLYILKEPYLRTSARWSTSSLMQ
jgi:hypothetical protein